NTRVLEIELVKDRIFVLRHHRGWTRLPPRPERHAQADHPTEAVGAQERGVPCYRRAPVVTDDHGRLRAQSVEQAYHVANQLQECVLLDLFRTVSLAIAAHVGRHRVEPGLRECPELMAPRVPGLRKAVTENDQRSSALLGQMHMDAVRFNDTVLHLIHRCLRSRHHCRLLRSGGRGFPKSRYPHGTEKRHELPPPHSITSSARASSESGTVRPSVLAALRLIVNSTLVDCWTGRSAGFSPLRIRPV